MGSVRLSIESGRSFLEAQGLFRTTQSLCVAIARQSREPSRVEGSVDTRVASAVVVPGCGSRSPFALAIVNGYLPA